MFLAMRPLVLLAGAVILVSLLSSLMVGPLLLLLPALCTGAAIVGFHRLPMAFIAFFLWMAFFEHV